MPFKSEQQLFEQAIASPSLRNLVGAMRYPTYGYVEPKGFFGIPDLVIANVDYKNGKAKLIRSFAFEMKLSNWKRAITQAYRYRAFVNLSFVVIDRSFLKPALENIGNFAKSNIGLISIDQSGFLNLHNTPKFEKPYCYELDVKFQKMILEEKKGNVLCSPDLVVCRSTAGLSDKPI